MIQENNIIIAEFDGWENCGINNLDDFYFKGDTNNQIHIKNIKDLNYHKSWDLLMPVIEKIEKLKHWKVTITGYCCVIGSGASDYFLKHNRDKFYAEFNPNDSLTKIENCCIAIVNFIKWYNEQKFK